MLLFRATPAMGMLLAIHLGSVLALFLSLPYGKFIHGILRFTALLKAAVVFAFNRARNATKRRAERDNQGEITSL